ncbi:MAG: 4Fe-4S dicluster domain-containing protein [Anaerolineae bacterium]|nr:4Fe-4S dicluster domain-containing protein [Anaerolineae bacterium]
MRHDIDPSQHGPHGEAMVKAIESCVHCGFCLAVCPTYNVLGEEMDSPRGRIYLMKSVLEGKIEQEDAQPYIDRCLGCTACVPACPSGVQYGELLIGYRGQSEAQRNRPLLDRVQRTMIRETLPYPDRFRLAAQAGRIGSLFEQALPEQMRAMIGLLPQQLPPAQPMPEIYPAKGPRRACVAFLSGCVQTVLAPDINHATLRVLAENGVETIIPRGQGCCGSMMMHIGETPLAQQLARKNLDVFPTDVDAIVTNAAGCGSGMHEYGLLFAHDPAEEQARAFAERVQDVTVFLDSLGFRPPQPLPQPMKVIYQDACHLLHAQGIQAPPRRLLGSVPNLTLLELNDGGLCCGSAGTYNLEQPEIAGELGRRKAERIIRLGADAVVSGNIGCLTQIRTHLEAKNQAIPLYHTIQLLDLAYHGAI